MVATGISANDSHDQENTSSDLWMQEKKAKNKRNTQTDKKKQKQIHIPAPYLISNFLFE